MMGVGMFVLDAACLRMVCGAVCVARCMGVRQSMVHSSYAVYAACCMAHLVCDRLCGTMHVVAHSLSLSVASHVLCHVADGTLPGASFCGRRLAEPGSELGTGFAVGTHSGVPGSGLPGRLVVRFRWIRLCWKPLKAPGGYCRVRIPFRPSAHSAERGATRQRF